MDSQGDGAVGVVVAGGRVGGRGRRMYIRELQVDGYGALQDARVALDAPVTVLHGPNEAGKSTLLRFIRSMLYGFPSRKDPVERGEPVRGGRHGGRLLLRGTDGATWLVERYAERGQSLVLRDEDGQERRLTQPEWERLALGGVSEKLFRQLFSVSLDELHQLRALQGEEIGHYLYHAGLAGGASLTAARRKINAEMDRLYRPKGATQEINKLLAAIKESESAIRQSRDRIDRFNELRAELGETERDISASDERLPLLRERVAEAQGAYELREWWLKERSLKLADAEARAALPDPGAPLLSEAAVLRWAELKAVRKETADKLGAAIEARDRLVDERKRIAWSEKLLADAAELERLESLREGIVARRDEEAELESERRMQAELSAAVIARLNPGWGEDELRTFGEAMAERESLRKLARERDSAERASAQLQGELKRLARAEEAMRTDADGFLGSSSPESSAVPSVEAANIGYAFVPQDREGLLRAWHRFEDAMRAYERALPAGYEAEHGAAIGRGRGSARLRRASAAGRTSRAMLGGFAAILAAAAVALPFALPGGSAAMTGAAVAVALAAGTLGLAALRRREGAAGSPPHLQSREQAAEADAYREQAAMRLRELLENAESAAIGLTAPGKASDEARRRLRDAVHAKFAELETRNLVAASREQRDRRTGELRAERELLEREAAEAAERLAEMDDRWLQWLRRYGLPDSLEPDGVAELFNQAEQALAALRQRQRIDERLRTIKHATEAFERDAGALIARHDVGPAIGSNRALAVRWLYSELANQRQAKQEAERADRLMEDARAHALKLEEQADEVRGAIAAFLDKAGVRDEAELELRLRVDETSRDLRREARDVQLRLESGRDEAARDKLYAWLNSHDEAALAASLEALRLELADEERRRTERLDRRGRLLQELERLRTDAELEDARQTLAEQESRLEALMERYAVLAIGERLMARAQAVFEEAKQPEVLRRASRYFRVMTGGAYARIVAPDDRSSLLAETADRRQTDSAFLSRGTQEQLYLAMRFALCDAASSERPLPLLLDDLFVHFDESRLQSTLPVLEELAEKRQIVLFTCHRHTAEAIENGIRGAKRLSLP